MGVNVDITMDDILALDHDEPFDFGDAKLIDHTRNSEPDIVVAEVIPPEDIEPFSIVNPNLEQGPWIAGGAALRWYQGKTVEQSTDIDVFCKSKEQAYNLMSKLELYNKTQVLACTNNAKTYRYHSYYDHDDEETCWTVQIITVDYFNSLKEILDRFDISVCQIGTAGNEFELGEHTAKDIKEKNLRFVCEHKPDTVKRLVKYWSYGYIPVEGTLDAISQNLGITWRFKNHEDYSDAF